MTKFVMRVPKWGVPQNGATKIQTFYLLSWTHEILKISKHEGKMKFGGTTIRGSSFNGADKNSNFFTTHARHVQFSG